MGLFREVDSRNASRWEYCGTCAAMMPLAHECNVTAQRVDDWNSQVDVDYESTEAYLQGWHGPGLQRKAEQAVRSGRARPNEQFRL